VQYDKQELVRRMRYRMESAVRQGAINMKESALLMKRYEEGLSGYTYLTDEQEETNDVIPAVPPIEGAVPTGIAQPEPVRAAPK